MSTKNLLALIGVFLIVAMSISDRFDLDESFDLLLWIAGSALLTALLLFALLGRAGFSLMDLKFGKYGKETREQIILLQRTYGLDKALCERVSKKMFLDDFETFEYWRDNYSSNPHIFYPKALAKLLICREYFESLRSTRSLNLAEQFKLFVESEIEEKASKEEMLSKIEKILSN